MKITAGGKEIDLEKAFPFTLGDLRKLKKLGVSYPLDFNPRDPEQTAIFVFYFCKKVVPEITEEEIDALLPEVAIDAVHFLVLKKEVVLDRPTSGASTDLPGTTAGDQTI